MPDSNQGFHNSKYVVTHLNLQSKSYT